VITRERNVDSFAGLRASNGLDVILVEGEVGNLSVKADENLHDIIKTEVSGGVLKIYTIKNIQKAKAREITVFISSNTLKSIRLSSAADLKSELILTNKNLDLSTSSAAEFKGRVEVENLDLSLSSASEIDIEGTAKDSKISSSSSADLNAENLSIGNCKVTTSSSADVIIKVTTSLVADVSSSGDITVSGQAETANVNVSSGADFAGFDFEVKEYKVRASSGGDAEINVSEKLTASASSGGDITYKGSPGNIDRSRSSGGSIDAY